MIAYNVDFGCENLENPCGAFNQRRPRLQLLTGQSTSEWIEQSDEHHNGHGPLPLLTTRASTPPLLDTVLIDPVHIAVLRLALCVGFCGMRAVTSASDGSVWAAKLGSVPQTALSSRPQ